MPLQSSIITHHPSSHLTWLCKIRNLQKKTVIILNVPKKHCSLVHFPIENDPERDILHVDPRRFRELRLIGVPAGPGEAGYTGGLLELVADGLFVLEKVGKMGMENGPKITKHTTPVEKNEDFGGCNGRSRVIEWDMG